MVESGLGKKLNHLNIPKPGGALHAHLSIALYFHLCVPQLHHNLTSTEDLTLTLTIVPVSIAPSIVE